MENDKFKIVLSDAIVGAGGKFFGMMLSGICCPRELKTPNGVFLNASTKLTQINMSNHSISGTYSYREGKSFRYG